MYSTVISVEGMKCPMCEAHANDAVKANFAVNKVTSSYKKKETRIVSEEPLDEERIREVISECGYEVLSVTVNTVSKGLFGK